MERIERDEVERVARLARLELTDEEVSRLAREMASVLGHFAEIRRFGTEDRGSVADPAAGGAPGEAGSQGGPLRPDRPDPDVLRRSVSEMAPDWRDGHFVVPRLSALSAADSTESGSEGPDDGTEESAGETST